MFGLTILQMKVKQLVLKFEEDKNEFVFDQQINFIDDKKLIKTLSKENIKNGNSSLIIKSMNDLPIYDVIQIKINVAEIGSFLANFNKSDFDENAREKIISQISELKDNVEPTKETQSVKIDKLLTILDRFNPIYVSFRNSNSIKFDEEDYGKIKDENLFAYPLLIIKNKENVKPIKIKLPIREKHEKEISGESKTSQEKPKKEIVIDFPLFSFDYLFTSLFIVLFGFGVVTGIFEILNKESIAAFLLVLAGIFLGVGYSSIYSVVYKKHKEISKGVKYWLNLYLLLGAAIGIAVGYVICRFALKTEIEINFNLILTISIPSVFVLSFASIWVIKLINLIILKRKNS